MKKQNLKMNFMSSGFIWSMAFLLTSLLVIPVGVLLWWIDILLLSGGVSAFAQPPSPMLLYILITIPETVVSPVFRVLLPGAASDGQLKEVVRILSLGTFYCYLMLSLFSCYVKLRLSRQCACPVTIRKAENDATSPEVVTETQDDAIETDTNHK